MDDTVTLELVEWEGRLHCVYLNSFRIAGGKPWGGGKIVRTWKVPVGDLLRAIPGLMLTEPKRAPAPDTKEGTAS